jgi:hypothetical protein
MACETICLVSATAAIATEAVIRTSHQLPESQPEPSDPSFRRETRDDLSSFASKSQFSDNDDDSNVNGRSCKCPPCKIGGTLDFVSSVTCSHDIRRLTKNIFRRHRPFSYGIDRPKVIRGGGVTGFSRCVNGLPRELHTRHNMPPI